jgi:hypothetical protein
MVESLHFLLELAAGAATGADPEDRAMLELLTEDRSSLTDDVRKRLAAEPARAAVRESQLVAAMLFERAVWLVRELAGHATAVRARADGQQPSRPESARVESRS